MRLQRQKSISFSTETAVYESQSPPQILLIMTGGILKMSVIFMCDSSLPTYESLKSAWVQDVPMRKSTVRHDQSATDFPGTLQRVLHSLNVSPALTKLLDGKVCISKTTVI